MSVVPLLPPPVAIIGCVLITLAVCAYILRDES